MKHKTKFFLLVCAGLVFWLWREVREVREMGRDRQRVHCLDHLCEGDRSPNIDVWKEVALKLTGQWFVGPREYFSTGINGASFEWWDHKPLSPLVKRPPAMQALAEVGKGYEFSIELFLRSHERVTLGPSRWHQLTQQAEAERRVNSKTTPREGLEVWRVINEVLKQPVVWYVATNYRLEDGEPPVLGCDDHNPKDDLCTTAFMWRPGIVADMRFRAKHGADWPEIWQETMRILQLLRKE